MSRTDHYTSYKFVKDKRTNQFSGVVDNFLKRQLFLTQHITLITKVSILRDIGGAGYMQLVHDQCNSKYVECERIIVNKKNKTKHERLLANYLAISLIAQAFENFELLIRDLYRISLDGIIKNEFLAREAKANMSRDNKKVLNDLKKLYPSLTRYLNDRFNKWFSTMEQLRHSVVHTDQVIKAKAFEKMTLGVLQQHFDIHSFANGTYRLKLGPNSGMEIMKTFDYYGYNIFAYISHDAKRPIKYLAEQHKKPKPPPKTTNAEFLQQIKDMKEASRKERRKLKREVKTK